MKLILPDILYNLKTKVKRWLRCLLMFGANSDPTLLSKANTKFTLPFDSSENLFQESGVLSGCMALFSIDSETK